MTEVVPGHIQHLRLLTSAKIYKAYHSFIFPWVRRTLSTDYIWKIGVIHYMHFS